MRYFLSKPLPPCCDQYILALAALPASGNVTVTGCANTVPSGAMLSPLAETPLGSLIGGDSRLPSEFTIVPLASTPKLPSRVSASWPFARFTSK